MQNLLMGIESLAGGVLTSGIGDGRVGMVDTRDVSECMEAAVRSSDFDGRALELTAPASISHHEVADALSAALGRNNSYQPVEPEAVGEAMRAFGGDWMADTITDYMRAYRSGFGDFVTDEVPSMTGRPARNIATFAREVLAPALRGAG
jgi:uncharacterized protein YbjT (DUF2867 family)